MEQLPLFHWWNACPETSLYGPDASRLPVHEGGYVWGRSGHQWIRSVIAYLDFRAGVWRPESHRSHPVRWHYIECVRIVSSAYYSNAKWWATPALLATGSNPAPEMPRKSVSNVHDGQAVPALRGRTKKAGVA